MNIYKRERPAKSTINEQFAVHILNEKGIESAKYIAAMFDDLLDELRGICAEGREFSIVKTKLEEACFFAKKAMAVNAVHQKDFPQQDSKQDSNQDSAAE